MSPTAGAGSSRLDRFWRGLRRSVLGGVLLALLPGVAAAVLGPLYGGRLRLAVPRLPDTLEPHRPADSGDRIASALVHETLIRLDRGAPAPGVAARWEVAAGGREWRLALSERARFHDGTPVRVEDALRSVRRFLRSTSTAAAVLAGRVEGGVAFRSGETSELPGATAGGDAVVLRMLRPTLGALAPLAAPGAAVTGPRGTGCGPFAPAVFEAGVRLDLAAAADHPAGRPFLDGVRLRASSSAPAAARGARPERLLLVLDATRPPFDDATRRAALASGLDREALARRFLEGALPVATLFGVPGAPFAPAAPAPWPASPAITLAVAEDVPPAASRRVVAHLAASGLDVSARPLPPAAARIAPVEARLLLWAPEVSEPALALREAATLARVPPAVERALRLAESETDAELREERLDEVHRGLLDHAAVIPLAALPLPIAIPAALHDARVDDTGALRLDGAWLVP